MKKLVGAVAMLVLVVATATSQRPRLFTRPTPPPRDVLERLNLKLAWQTRVLTDGGRDGLASIQLLPARGGHQIIVQTRQGFVVALDAETGDLQWQTLVGMPYQPSLPVAFNSRALYITRRDRLYALDRSTGKHLFESLDARTNLRTQGIILSSVPSTTAVADELYLFIPLGSRVSALELPLEGKPRTGPAGKPAPVLEEGTAPYVTAAPAAASAPVTAEPLRKWDAPLDGLRIEQPLLLAGPALAAVSPGGTFFSLSALDRTDPIVFKTAQPVTAALGQYEDIAYLASEDSNLYALKMGSSDQVWRFKTDAPIFRTPTVTARDVYVAPDRIGLFRVDRETGLARWLNKDAVQFLAVNRDFVYAIDRLGRFLVVDYARGSSLAVYDTRDFTIRIANELTDRIYLAGHDGLIVCLHHKDQAAPLLNKLPPAKPAPKKPKPKEDEDKDDKKADDKDEKKADKDDMDKDEKKAGKDKDDKKADKEEKKADKDKDDKKAKNKDDDAVRVDWSHAAVADGLPRARLKPASLPRAIASRRWDDACCLSGARLPDHSWTGAGP
jgi:outer membrane protein assembly factor BamB